MPFNTKKYNATRKKVLKFLEKNPESTQSIVLHGKAGTGKSRMLSELQLDFENNGYTCIADQSPTRVTRSITPHKVFAWSPNTDLDLKTDDRFVVFSF